MNYLTRYSIPKAVSETKRTNPGEVKWKWRNVLTSFIHSTITGIWAPLAFAAQPSLGADMIHAYSTSSHALISISIGYFIYDFCDMAIFHRKGSTYELLVHHGMVRPKKYPSNQILDILPIFCRSFSALALLSPPELM